MVFPDNINGIGVLRYKQAVVSFKRKCVLCKITQGQVQLFVYGGGGGGGYG